MWAIFSATNVRKNRSTIVMVNRRE